MTTFVATVLALILVQIHGVVVEAVVVGMQIRRNQAVTKQVI